MVFGVISNIMIALLELRCARNKPDKVATIISDVEELAAEEKERILSHHISKCKCYWRISKRSVVM